MEMCTISIKGSVNGLGFPRQVRAAESIGANVFIKPWLGPIREGIQLTVRSIVTYSTGQNPPGIRLTC